MIYRLLLRLLANHPILYCLATFTIFAAISSTVLRWAMGAPWEVVVCLTLPLGVGSTAFGGHWITRDL